MASKRWKMWACFYKGSDDVTVNISGGSNIFMNKAGAERYAEFCGLVIKPVLVTVKGGRKR